MFFYIHSGEFPLYFISPFCRLFLFFLLFFFHPGPSCPNSHQEYCRSQYNFYWNFRKISQIAENENSQQEQNPHCTPGCRLPLPVLFLLFFLLKKLQWHLHFSHVLFLISDFCIALCNFLFTVLRSIKQFLNIFQLHPWLHGFSVNSISKIYSCRILMVKFGQQIFGQFPKLFLHRMVIIRQAAERNLFFLHIQKNIFRAKHQLFRIQKKLCHFFYYMEKSFQNHFQIFSLQFTLFVKRCQRLL